MKTDEILNLVQRTIAEHPNANLDSVDDRLILSIPEPRKHNGYRVRLFGSRGPHAVIVNGARGRLTVYVSARRLLLYLDRFAHEESTN